jgi:arsenate reductase
LLFLLIAQLALYETVFLSNGPKAAEMEWGMERKKILFVCTYGGARSRIAEEFVRRSAPDKIEAYSSSFESGKIGPLPINAMREVGIDLPAETPKSVFERYKEREVFDYVISLCHEATTEQCPVFKTNIDTLYARDAERISWSIPDFKSLSGTEEERKAGAREIRDKIKSEVILFLAQIGIDAEIA